MDGIYSEPITFVKNKKKKTMAKIKHVFFTKLDYLIWKRKNRKVWYRKVIDTETGKIYISY